MTLSSSSCLFNVVIPKDPNLPLYPFLLSPWAVSPTSLYTLVITISPALTSKFLSQASATWASQGNTCQRVKTAAPYFCIPFLGDRTVAQARNLRATQNPGSPAWAVSQKILYILIISRICPLRTPLWMPFGQAQSPLLIKGLAPRPPCVHGLTSRHLMIQ